MYLPKFDNKANLKCDSYGKMYGMLCLFVFWHKSRRLYFLARLSSSWLVRLKHQRMRAMHCGSIETNIVQKRLECSCADKLFVTAQK